MFNAMPELIEDLSGEPGILNDAAIALMWAMDEITQLREDVIGAQGAVIQLTDELDVTQGQLARALRQNIAIANRNCDLEERLEEFEMDSLRAEQDVEFEWATR